MISFYLHSFMTFQSGECVRVLEHKGAVISCRFLLPPAAMLDPEAWSPARRLAALQKGADETEPFACRLFSRTDKGVSVSGQGATNLEQSWVEVDPSPAAATTSVPGGDEEDGLSIEELKQINHELYKFAVKNILNAK